MVIDSPLSPAAYKSAVRDKLENYRHIWDERYTGRFIGPLFCITHHSYWEWNRQITGEMNHAIGYLKKTDSGCQVHFIHTTGIVSPIHLLRWFFLFLILNFIGTCSAQVEFSFAIAANTIGSLLGVLLVALGTAISNAMTENGILGYNTLCALLDDPTFGEREEE